MQFPATPFSRVLALLGLLLVAITMVCSGMSLEAGVWQKVLPLSILAGGAVLLVQMVSLISTGSSSVAANLVWRFTGAFAFFVAAFSMLVVVFPDLMWEVTKGTDPLPAGLAAGVDPKLRDVVDVSGPLSPSALLVINILLMAVAFLGSLTEDSNPELDPVN